MEKFKNNDDVDFKNIIEELTPKFAPETKMTFKQPNIHNSKYRILIRRSLKVAAVAIIAIIGATILRPEPIHAIPQIIENASQQLKLAQSCVIKFSGKVEYKDDGSELYNFSPFGKDIEGIFTIMRENEHTYLRVEWIDEGNKVIQIFEDDNYRLVKDGKVIKSLKSGDCKNIYSLLSSMEYIENDYNNLKVEKIGDNVRLSTTKNGLKISGDFSGKDDRLLSAKVQLINRNGNPITILQTHSIAYNRPITKAEILKTTD